MGFNTVVQAIDNKTHDVLWEVRTRRDFISLYGKAPESRRERKPYWKVADPAGVNSLNEIDEVGMFTRAFSLSWQLERLVSGNSKQRRAYRRKHLKYVRQVQQYK